MNISKIDCHAPLDWRCPNCRTPLLRLYCDGNLWGVCDSCLHGWVIINAIVDDPPEYNEADAIEVISQYILHVPRTGEPMLFSPDGLGGVRIEYVH